MGKVRLLPDNSDDWDFVWRDYEYESTCRHCGEAIGVLASPAQIKKMNASDDDFMWEYMGEHWFSCPKCAKEYD